VEKPEGKQLSGRPRHRWDDNIKMDFRETGLVGVVWIHLAQKSPVVCSSEHGNEISGSIKCWEFSVWLSNC
jgi:hypothetical protein